jgi:hypothetical protein
MARLKIEAALLNSAAMAKATKEDVEAALRLLGLDTLSPTQKETVSLIVLDWRNAGRAVEFQTDGYALALVR